MSTSPTAAEPRPRGSGQRPTQLERLAELRRSPARRGCSSGRSRMTSCCSCRRSSSRTSWSPRMRCGCLSATVIGEAPLQCSASLGVAWVTNRRGSADVGTEGGMVTQASSCAPLALPAALLCVVCCVVLLTRGCVHSSFDCRCAACTPAPDAHRVRAWYPCLALVSAITPTRVKCAAPRQLATTQWRTLMPIDGWLLMLRAAY